MLIPSALYGCEVWGPLRNLELEILERAQKKVAKAIQGLHRRTHDEVARGLLGWKTIAGTIDLCKLYFVYKLMSLPSENLIKHVFLCQIFPIITGVTAQKPSLTYDLWAVLTKYDSQGMVLDYLSTGNLVPKMSWKAVTKQAVHEREKCLFEDGLARKGARRFLRVHQTLSPHFIYRLIGENMPFRKELTNVIKLLAFPQNVDPCACELCDSEYIDTVEHCLQNCDGLVRERYGPSINQMHARTHTHT